mmetsp:Transcript_17080/g.47810  ORF Transcript_17080/g.47810 Transcript_17080/m.47810 type:complete len:213 (-) Transcript_17080:1186-1824(-)
MLLSPRLQAIRRISSLHRFNSRVVFFASSSDCLLKLSSSSSNSPFASALMDSISKSRHLRSLAFNANCISRWLFDSSAAFTERDSASRKINHSPVAGGARRHHANPMHARRRNAGAIASTAATAAVAIIVSTSNAKKGNLRDMQMARADAATTGMTPRLMATCFRNCHTANTAITTRIMVTARGWLRACLNTSRPRRSSKESNDVALTCFCA